MPLNSGIKLNYEDLKNVRTSESISRPPNGVLWTGPGYGVNHQVNNNSVVGVTRAVFNNSYTMGQLDETQPSKGSFLYPLTLGMRPAMVTAVLKNGKFPTAEEDQQSTSGHVRGRSPNRRNIIGQPSARRARSRRSPSPPMKKKRGRPPARGNRRYPADGSYMRHGCAQDDNDSAHSVQAWVNTGARPKVGGIYRGRLRSNKKTRSSSSCKSVETIQSHCSHSQSYYEEQRNNLNYETNLTKQAARDKMNITNEEGSSNNSDINEPEERTEKTTYAFNYDNVVGFVVEPKFSVKFSLDFKVLFDWLLTNCKKYKGTGPVLQVQVGYVNSRTEKSSILTYLWNFKDGIVSGPNFKVDYPYGLFVLIKSNCLGVRSDPSCGEILYDATEVAALVHFQLEYSSRKYWTVDPSALGTFDQKVRSLQGNRVSITQGKPGYRSIKLVPTSSDIQDIGANLTCSKNNILQFLRSYGDEIMAAAHGQSNVIFQEGNVGGVRTAFTTEVDMAPNDSWGYQGVEYDLVTDGGSIGCADKLILPKASRLLYWHVIGYDSNGKIYNCITPITFTYNGQYLKKTNTDTSASKLEPESLYFTPSAKVTDQFLSSLPDTSFNLFWHGFWSKKSKLEVDRKKVTIPTTADFSLKGLWFSQIHWNPVKPPGFVVNQREYASIKQGSETRYVEFDFNQIQRANICLVPLVVPVFEGSNVKTPLDESLANLGGFNLLYSQIPTDLNVTQRGITWTMRANRLNDNKSKNIDMKDLKVFSQRPVSLGLLGRDYLEGCPVLENAIVEYQIFDSLTGLINYPSVRGTQPDLDINWENYGDFSFCRNTGMCSSFFCSGQSARENYNLLTLPSNYDLLIFRFFKYVCQMFTSKNREWVVGLAKDIVDTLPLDKQTKETVNEVISWVDTILGILETVAGFLTGFFEPGEFIEGVRVEGAAKRISYHFEDFRPFTIPPRDAKKLYYCVKLVTDAGFFMDDDELDYLYRGKSVYYLTTDDTGQSRSSVPIGQPKVGADLPFWYGAVPRHAVKCMKTPIDNFSPSPDMSLIFQQFKQSFHELRNQGSMLNGFLTYDLLKNIFSSTNTSGILPDFKLGVDKLILTYHAWVNTLLAGNFFDSDQIALKLPSLSSFNAFAFADIEPITVGGTPVSAINRQEGSGRLIWLETNQLGVWDICGNPDYVLPRWGENGSIEFTMGDILDQNATQVLFVPADWQRVNEPMRMVAIFIILVMGWGRFYPVVTHSFTNEQEELLEAVFAVNAGWLNIEGCVNLKVVIPARFPVSGARYTNEAAARSAMFIVPTYGPYFGHNREACPITFVDNNAQVHINLTDGADFVMSWLPDLGLNDLLTFSSQMAPYIDLNENFFDWMTLINSLSVFHGPAVVVPKTAVGAEIDLFSRQDLIESTSDPLTLPNRVIVREYPHLNAENLPEDAFLPLSDTNRNVPNIYHMRRHDLGDNFIPYSLLYTHGISLLNTGRLSLVMLKIYQGAQSSSSKGYDLSSTMLYESYHLSTTRSAVSAMSYSLMGIPPSFVILEPGDEKNSQGYQDYFHARTDPKYRNVVLKIASILSRSVLNYKNDFPLWIESQVNFDTLIITGWIDEHSARYDQFYGDIITVKLVYTDVEQPYYGIERGGSRFNYSKLSLNIVSNELPDWFKLFQRVSEFMSEQPTLLGLHSLMRLIRTEAGVRLVEGKPLVPSPLNRGTWETHGEYWRPDNYYLTLGSIIPCCCIGPDNNTTFSITQVDGDDLHVEPIFSRIGPNHLISEIQRANTLAWVYGANELVPQGMGLIVPWSYTLKRPALNSVSPLVVTSDNSRYSIEFLQGYRHIGINQVFIDKIGAKIEIPIVNIDNGGTDAGFDSLFGPSSSSSAKNSKTSGDVKSTGLKSPETAAADPISSVPVPVPEISKSQDTGSLSLPIA